MSNENEKYHLLGFQEAVGSAMNNELSLEARKHEEDRRKRLELQKAANPRAMNATELLGLKTEQEIAAEIGEEMDKIEQESTAAAEEYEKENEIDDDQPNFPAPIITG